MITADLDQQLHGWSIDAIDNHNGCAVFLQKLEEHTVWDDVAVVAIHPLIIPDGHERGVVITVGVNDGTGLEAAEFIGFRDGDEFTIHDVLRFLSGSQVENCSLSSHISELMDGDVEIGILNKLVNADALRKVSRTARKPVGRDPVFIILTRVEYWHENMFAGVDDALFLLE